MNVFDHKDLGDHLLQLCPKVVKHPVYIDSHAYILYFPLFLVTHDTRKLKKILAFTYHLERENREGPDRSVTVLQPPGLGQL